MTISQWNWGYAIFRQARMDTPFAGRKPTANSSTWHVSWRTSAGSFHAGSPPTKVDHVSTGRSHFVRFWPMNLFDSFCIPPSFSPRAFTVVRWIHHRPRRGLFGDTILLHACVRWAIADHQFVGVAFRPGTSSINNQGDCPGVTSKLANLVGKGMVGCAIPSTSRFGWWTNEHMSWLWCWANVLVLVMNSGVSRCSPVGCNDSALQLLRFQIAVPKIPEMHAVSHVITEQVLHRKSVQGPFSKHRVAGRRLRLHQMRGRTLDTCFTALLYCQTHTAKKQTCQKRERERYIYIYINI